MTQNKICISYFVSEITDCPEIAAAPCTVNLTSNSQTKCYLWLNIARPPPPKLRLCLLAAAAAALFTTAGAESIKS
jgi:hypothetical protein